MSECVNNYYICNGDIFNSSFFKDSYIKEGKSLYEVIRVIDGTPLFLEEHLGRMMNSSKLANENLFYNEFEIVEALNELIKINEAKQGNVKIVFNYKEEGNKFYAYFISHYYPSEKEYIEGVDTILYHGERENPNAKIINTSFRNLVDKEVKESGVYEAILVNRCGYITEGSKSNIFMVKGNEVLTAPIEDVLPGITRKRIIDICKELGYIVKEERIHYSDINKLDGLFISGTSPKVLPIKSVGNINIASSTNKIILDILEKYNERISEYIKNFNTKFKSIK